MNQYQNQENYIIPKENRKTEKKKKKAILQDGLRTGQKETE
jgi:hypothetical protein